MKIFLTVIVACLIIAVPSFGSTNAEMTPTQLAAEHRDIGRVLVKVTRVQGNPLAQDFTLVNPELIFADLKNGEWVPFFESEMFSGGNQAEEILGLGPFAKKGMDISKSRVSRKTVRIVYLSEVYYGSARFYLHGFLLGSSSGHGVWEAK